MNNRTTTVVINTLVIVAALIVVAVIVLLIVEANRPSSESTHPADPTSSPVVLRDDTHVLDDPPDAKVVLVEFLDFECEACGAFKPYVENVRQEFAGDIKFAIRYFPLPSHGNSMNAAIAAEAASQQGQLEAMYNRLFETQGQWGEKGGESQAPLFRTFAEELGLDMDAYDAAVADPATAARVESDFNDGRSLGVDSTPTFFLNGQPVELNAYEDLASAVRSAVEG